MRRSFFLITVVLALLSCGHNKEDVKTSSSQLEVNQNTAPFVMVFASCNDQEREQPLWKPILETQADLFVWGGDNIYSDTDDMDKMRSDYQKIYSHPDYQALRQQVAITGTWDDHDYGLGDGGVEWAYKEEAKQLMLDFLDAPQDDIRRSRAGVYTAQTYQGEAGSVRIILLDTRSFRTAIKKSESPLKKYEPWPLGHSGTLLGEDQWMWLEEELSQDQADFTVIISSIQFLSDQHGWEMWGNFPDEVSRLHQLLDNASARNIMILSGDRHLGEISRFDQWSKPYPLIDFTSSGLTHTYVKFGNHPNKYRISNIIKRLNYGVIRFDFEQQLVSFEIRGREGFLYESYTQQY